MDIVKRAFSGSSLKTSLSKKLAAADSVRVIETQPIAVEALRYPNLPDPQPVYFSEVDRQDGSRVRVNSIIGGNVDFLSCDEKDVYINPWSLSNDLSRIDTPNLSSMTPICVSYMADGFPKIEGKPWNGTNVGRPSSDPSQYDPSDPSTLVSYGLVVDKNKGNMPFSILGFRVKLSVFDTNLGTSTVGIRVFSKNYDTEILNALLTLTAANGEIVIPFFAENVVRNTAGAGDWTKTQNMTLRFFANSGFRDGSYNLVFAHPTTNPATIADLPSFFTVTGANVYTYVTPILGTDKNVSALMSTLRTDPTRYLEVLQKECV